MGTPPASPTSGLADQLPMYGLMRGPRIERMAKKIRQVRKSLLAKWEKCGNLRGAAGMPAGEIYKHETRI